MWTGTVPAAGSHPEWRWCHYDLVTAAARQEIDADPRLTPFCKAILLGSDESPRILADDYVVTGSIPTYSRTGNVGDYELASWNFAMTPDYLVTGRRSASRSLLHVWENVQAGHAPVNPAAALHEAITYFSREVRQDLAQLSADLDPIEDMLLSLRETEALSHATRKLGQVRRKAARLKRVLLPLARALDEDELEHVPDWALPPANDPSLRLVHAAIDDITSLNDRARALQDELTSRMTEETNRRLYLVSVVTTLAVPLTVITGFFGMNTGGLLWTGDDQPHGAIYAALLCVSAVAVLLVILRRKRLL